MYIELFSAVNTRERSLIFGDMIEMTKNFSKHLLIFMLLSGSATAKSQKENNSKWSNFKQSLKYTKEDISIGTGLNVSGIYTSKYRNETQMGFGTHVFGGAYLPYSDNMFVNAQLGVSYQKFQHQAFGNKVTLQMIFVELPIFISAQLPISNTVETRLLMGWQSNLVIHKNQTGDYPSMWSEDPARIQYNKQDLFKADFGFYFGLAAEYKRWLVRTSGFIGINKIINQDTGMLNTFRLDVGYFIFRK